MERSHQHQQLRKEEHDTLSKLKQMPVESLNLEAISIATNLYRSAQRLRVKMETEVLSSYNLSWTAFSILYDLWVWGALETRKIAELSGISTATASNVIKTLEKRVFAVKASTQEIGDSCLSLSPIPQTSDRRTLPEFHKGETELIAGMTKDEQKILTGLLRKVADNLHTT